MAETVEPSAIIDATAAEIVIINFFMGESVAKTKLKIKL